MIQRLSEHLLVVRVVWSVAAPGGSVADGSISGGCGVGGEDQRPGV